MLSAAASMLCESAANEPFFSVPTSPKLPAESNFPCAEKLPSLYATENVPEFVAGDISPSQWRGPIGSCDFGAIWRAFPVLLNTMLSDKVAGIRTVPGNAISSAKVMFCSWMATVSGVTCIALSGIWTIQKSP